MDSRQTRSYTSLLVLLPPVASKTLVELHWMFTSTSSSNLKNKLCSSMFFVFRVPGPLIHLLCFVCTCTCSKCIWLNWQSEPSAHVLYILAYNIYIYIIIHIYDCTCLDVYIYICMSSIFRYNIFTYLFKIYTFNIPWLMTISCISLLCWSQILISQFFAVRMQGTFAVSMDGWKRLDLQWQQCFCWLI